MTIPNQVNCLHNDDGWCFDCVGKLLQESASERERCARIAEQTNCEIAPVDYRVTAPGLEGLCEDYERQQCYHGDRIAQRIREGATQ